MTRKTETEDDSEYDPVEDGDQYSNKNLNEDHDSYIGCAHSDSPQHFEDRCLLFTFPISIQKQEHSTQDRQYNGNNDDKSL